MGREIINLQVGQAGNQVAEAFWEMLLAEHGLTHEGFYEGTDPLQIARADVYFTEIDSGSSKPRYVPRSVQIDLESGVTDRIRSGPMGRLFRPDTFIAGNSGADYTEGAELIDSITDVVRKQLEAVDGLQGFQMVHSLGGGTGAGLGSLLLSKLREEHPDRMLATFSIVPSPKVSDTVVEPYNTLLTMNQLVENSDLTICLDNEALYDITQRTLKTKSSGFNELNKIIATAMCGTSTSLRFPGQLNSDLRKMSLNLVPFPRLHFLVPSYAPFHGVGSAEYSSLNVAELTSSLFDRRNILVACDPRFGRYLTVATIYRGSINSREVEHAVQEFQTRNSPFFVEWIPDNVSISLCRVPPIEHKKAATALSNTTAIQELAKRSHEQFSAMLRRRAFLHWYQGDGMDEMEFTEAASNINDLMAEYQQYQEATAEDEVGEYYEEEGPFEEGSETPDEN